MNSTETAPRTRDSIPALRVLGGFSFHLGDARLDVPPAGQRVLALLAVLGGAATRSRLAGTLWPDHPERRALSNLRAAVWRLPTQARDLVERQGASMRLAPSVWVDLREAEEVARRLLNGHGEVLPETRQWELLIDDLLPSADEAWAVVPREQHRQHRLHALETLARQQLACGRALDAVDTALTAVAAEPLRESAQMLVVRGHLAAGNRAAALQHFENFREALDHEMGVSPSPELIELLRRASDGRRLSR